MLSSTVCHSWLIVGQLTAIITKDATGITPNILYTGVKGEEYCICGQQESLKHQSSFLALKANSVIALVTWMDSFTYIMIYHVFMYLASLDMSSCTI